MKDIYKRLSILLLFIVIVELAILFSIGKESFQRNLINFVNQVQNKKPPIEKVEKYYIADSEGNPIDKLACSEFWKAKDSYRQLQDTFYKYMVKDFQVSFQAEYPVFE